MSNPTSRSRLYLPIVLVLLLGGAMLYAFWQQLIISALRTENQALLQVSAEVERLRQENGQIQEWRARAEEVEKLRKDNVELNRLRNEVRQLRAQSTELEQLRMEHQRLQGSTQQLLQQKQAAESQLAQASADQTAAMAAKAKTESLQCVNQLKQIGLAGRLWAAEHNEALPLDFLSMSQALANPAILVCPSDTARTPAGGWPQFQQANVSYALVSPGASTSDPGKVFVQCTVHGHLCLGDGSVQQAKPAQ